MIAALGHEAEQAAVHPSLMVETNDIADWWLVLLYNYLSQVMHRTFLLTLAYDSPGQQVPETNTSIQSFLNHLTDELSSTILIVINGVHSQLYGNAVFPL